MTALERRPCRSSTSESIEPEQSLQIALQCAFGIGETLAVTLYSSEPMTMARISPPFTWRSTTEPLRT